jgi:malonyl-CoA O-methyltransferase
MNYPYTQSVIYDFSRAANGYDAHAQLQQSVMESLLFAAETYIPADATVLDIGCGTGNFARAAHVRMPKWQIDGLDLSPAMCAKAAPFYRAVVQGDMAALPVAPFTYDACVSNLALQWCARPAQAIAEMARILPAGGYAVFSTFTSNTLIELRDSSREAGLHETVMPFASVAELQQWIEQADCFVEFSRRVQETHHVPEVMQLVKQLRGVGATNKLQTRPKHLSSAGRFSAMMRAYQSRYKTPLGIPVTWDIAMFILKKPLV